MLQSQNHKKENFSDFKASFIVFENFDKKYEI